MPRKKTRRQAHGSAWHWKQTDCWYYTPPGSKGRQPLFDEHGQRIRGLDNRQAAQLALARLKLAGDDAPPPPPPESPSEWLVARVCSEYLQYCQRGVEHGRLSQGHTAHATRILNDLCKYCGALPVAQLQKKHVEDWVASHTGWESPVTRRSALTVVLAAFHYAQDNCGVPSPLRGLKKPPARPRLHSFSPEDEKLLYQAAAGPFGDFLFAGLHTGLRPYCELARLKAEDVSQTERGMLWRVYSSKTKKTRKIPVRPEVAELTRRLLKEAPPGSGRPLFRTSQGKPWIKENGVWRFLRLKRQLGWDQDPVRKKYCCYSCRHTFAHRMLSGYWNAGAGCSIETLAELLGDTPKVAFDHYGKEWGQHYQEPLWSALGVPAPQRDQPPPVPDSDHQDAAQQRKGKKTPGKGK